MNEDATLATDMKRRGLMAPVLIIGLITAVSIGAGWFLASNIAKPTQAGEESSLGIQAESKATTGGEKETDKEGEHAATLVKLEPIIVNLKEPKDAFLRLEMFVALEAADQDIPLPDPPYLADVISKFLKTVDYTRYQGPSGYLNFRADLLFRLRMATDDQSRNIYISSVVIE